MGPRLRGESFPAMPGMTVFRYQAETKRCQIALVAFAWFML
jgi:hypothetical protein